jgi:hypothetical protein
VKTLTLGTSKTSGNVIEIQEVGGYPVMVGQSSSIIPLKEASAGFTVEVRCQWYKTFFLAHWSWWRGKLECLSSSMVCKLTIGISSTITLLSIMG